MGKWETVRLGDVCVGVASNIAQKDLEDNTGNYPIYGASGFIKNVNFFKHDSDYVAVVKDGAGIGRTTFHPAKSSVIGTMQAIIPNATIVSKYLYYAVSKMNLARYCTGATIPHIYFKDYKSETLLLPHLSMQQQISDMLDCAYELIEKRKAQIAKLDLLIKSQFLHLVGTMNADYSKWEEKCFKELVKNEKKDMRTGPFGSDLLHSEFVESGISVLGIDNAVDNVFQWKEMRFITEEKFRKLERYTVFPQDVIITIMGTIGRSAVVPNNIQRAINTKHLACITLDKNVANPYFIAYCIHSHPYVYSQIQRQNKGAIMNGLNLTIIKNLSVPLPPIAVQNQFSDFVFRVEAQKSLLQKSLEKMELNCKSLMQKCFRGEVL